MPDHNYKTFKRFVKVRPRISAEKMNVVNFWIFKILNMPCTFEMAAHFDLKESEVLVNITFQYLTCGRNLYKPARWTVDSKDYEKCSKIDSIKSGHVLVRISVQIFSNLPVNSVGQWNLYSKIWPLHWSQSDLSGILIQPQEMACHRLMTNLREFW